MGIGTRKVPIRKKVVLEVVERSSAIVMIHHHYHHRHTQQIRKTSRARSLDQTSPQIQSYKTGGALTDTSPEVPRRDYTRMIVAMKIAKAQDQKKLQGRKKVIHRKVRKIATTHLNQRVVASEKMATEARDGK